MQFYFYFYTFVITWTAGTYDDFYCKPLKCSTLLEMSSIYVQLTVIFQ